MSRVLTIAFVTLALPACFTSQAERDWDERFASSKFHDEKVEFKRRLKEKNLRICWSVGMEDFLFSSAPKPDEDCLYPATRYGFCTYPTSDTCIIDRDWIYRNKTLHVGQITKKGIVVESIFTNNSGLAVFVHKTDESGLVDGSYLERDGEKNLYFYGGPYAYKNVLGGTRTIHSFIKSNAVKKALEGLETYNPFQEIGAKIQGWEGAEP